MDGFVVHVVSLWNVGTRCSSHRGVSSVAIVVAANVGTGFPSCINNLLRTRRITVES